MFNQKTALEVCFASNKTYFLFSLSLLSLATRINDIRAGILGNGRNTRLAMLDSAISNLQDTTNQHDQSLAS